MAEDYAEGGRHGAGLKVKLMSQIGPAKRWLVEWRELLFSSDPPSTAVLHREPSTSPPISRGYTVLQANKTPKLPRFGTSWNADAQHSHEFDDRERVRRGNGQGGRPWRDGR